MKFTWEIIWCFNHCSHRSYQTTFCESEIPNNFQMPRSFALWSKISPQWSTSIWLSMTSYSTSRKITPLQITYMAYLQPKWNPKLPVPCVTRNSQKRLQYIPHLPNSIQKCRTRICNEPANHFTSSAPMTYPAWAPGPLVGAKTVQAVSQIENWHKQLQYKEVQCFICQTR